MFSRAVDPKADAGRIAAVLTRTTLAVALVTAIPACDPSAHGSCGSCTAPQFADAGVALRLILPGIVAYSVVAVLSRYITGRGRPGTGTLILVAGLALNIGANLFLIPRYGIRGAAAASSLSYIVTAALTLVVFHRLSGRGLRETLVIRRSDIQALMAAARALIDRARRQADRSAGRAAWRRSRRPTWSSASANPARSRRVGIRLVVIDDNPHLAWEGRTHPVNATFERFVAAVLDVPGGRRSPRSRRACRSGAADAPPASLPLDPRIRRRGDGAVRWDRGVPAAPPGAASGANRPILCRAIARGRSRLAQGAGVECGAGRGDRRGAPASRASCGSRGAQRDVAAGQFDGVARRRGARGRRRLRRCRAAGRCRRTAAGGRRGTSSTAMGSSRAWSSRPSCAIRRRAPWPPAHRRASGSPGPAGSSGARGSRPCSRRSTSIVG